MSAWSPTAGPAGGGPHEQAGQPSLRRTSARMTSVDLVGSPPADAAFALQSDMAGSYCAEFVIQLWVVRSEEAW